MKEFIRIGVDLGKRYFQIHALVDAKGHAVARKLPRSQFLAFFTDFGPCLIGMEACGSAPLSQTKGLGAGAASYGPRG